MLFKALLYGYVLLYAAKLLHHFFQMRMLV